MVEARISLEITIESGEGLLACDRNGASDPYVVSFLEATNTFVGRPVQVCFVAFQFNLILVFAFAICRFKFYIYVFFFL